MKKAVQCAFFQSLENSANYFPILGKFMSFFSNPWRPSDFLVLHHPSTTLLGANEALSKRRCGRFSFVLFPSFPERICALIDNPQVKRLPWGCHRRRAWGRTSPRVPTTGRVSLLQMQGEADGAGLVSAPTASTPQMGQDHAPGRCPMPVARPGRPVSRT